MQTITSPDGSIEIKVVTFSNKFLFGSLAGELRKKKVIPSEQPKKPKKKDPEENLGNVITTLDTGKIERGVDFITLQKIVEDELEKRNITYKDFFSDTFLVSSLCENFELTLKELVSLMMEHLPSVFNIGFLKGTIKPFIAKIMYEKYHYDNETNLNRGYQRIFEFL